MFTPADPTNNEREKNQWDPLQAAHTLKQAESHFKT